MATPLNLLIENYDGGYTLQNQGIRTNEPVYIGNDLTVTGTTSIAGISLTDLSVTGNTTIGNAATDTLAVTGVSTFTAGAATDAVNIDGTAITTGKAIDIIDLAALTSGIGINVTSAATAITGAGRLIYSSHGGATTTSGILNEFRSTATDETVIAQVTATAALALGKALNISGAAVTTGKLLSIDNADALTTGNAVSVTSNSSDATARSIVYVKNDHASATSAVCLELVNDAPLAPIKTTTAATSTNYFKVGTFNGVTLWVGNGNTANAVLSGTAGDILFNGGSNKPEYCTGTTNWTALV